jgi:hypothetical protein
MSDQEQLPFGKAVPIGLTTVGVGVLLTVIAYKTSGFDIFAWGVLLTVAGGVTLFVAIVRWNILSAQRDRQQPPTK